MFLTVLSGRSCVANRVRLFGINFAEFIAQLNFPLIKWVSFSTQKMLTLNRFALRKSLQLPALCSEILQLPLHPAHFTTTINKIITYID